MKELFKKPIILITNFLFITLGVSSYCYSSENHIEELHEDIGLSYEIDFNTKLSKYFAGTATIVNSNNSSEAESLTDVNDWTTENYTEKSPVSLNNFYVEYLNRSFTGGAGFKTFPESDGLVSTLQDIEYQFFPVDATNPLRTRRIGVPAVWGKYYFDPNTYVNIVGYETIWSKISPDAVPDFKNMRLENPRGNPGYSVFSSFGKKFESTTIEAGFSRSWVPWPSEERETTSEFSPNPFKVSATYLKVCKKFDSFELGGTALVKDANENAGSVYNMLFSVGKEIPIGRKIASISTSYFYVQSFKQSRHLRTSPWEDLGNSFSFRATIEEKDKHVLYGVEGVVNHEEHGYYLMGISEKKISNSVKVRSQMDFVYDKQKYISNDYDSIQISGYVSYQF